jgi:hypothetical protein
MKSDRDGDGRHTSTGGRMRRIVAVSLICALPAPLLAASNVACVNKLEPEPRLAKGHWKGDWSYTLNPGAGHPEIQFTIRWDGDLEFTLASESEEIWPLPPPPSPTECDEMETQGKRHEMCTREYAERAAKAVRVEDREGSLNVSGTATSNFKMDDTAPGVSLHGGTTTPVHLAVNVDRAGDKLFALLLGGTPHNGFDATVKTATQFADSQSNIRVSDGQVTSEDTGHVHAGTTNAEVNSKRESEIPRSDEGSPMLRLELFSQECGSAAGIVRSVGSHMKFPIVEGQWKAFHDERNEALEDEVGRYVSAAIPETVTEEYLSAATATYERFRGNGSDYRVCVAQKAFLKLKQIKTVYQIQEIRRDYAAKAAAATEGQQLCHAGGVLLGNLRVLELQGLLTDDCSLPGDAMNEMRDAGVAFHARTGKWPRC